MLQLNKLHIYILLRHSDADFATVWGCSADSVITLMFIVTESTVLL